MVPPLSDKQRGKLPEVAGASSTDSGKKRVGGVKFEVRIPPTPARYAISKQEHLECSPHPLPKRRRYPSPSAPSDEPTGLAPARRPLQLPSPTPSTSTFSTSPTPTGPPSSAPCPKRRRRHSFQIVIPAFPSSSRATSPPLRLLAARPVHGPFSELKNAAPSFPLLKVSTLPPHALVDREPPLPPILPPNLILRNPDFYTPLPWLAPAPPPPPPKALSPVTLHPINVYPTPPPTTDPSIRRSTQPSLQAPSSTSFAHLAVLHRPSPPPTTTARQKVGQAQAHAHGSDAPKKFWDDFLGEGDVHAHRRAQWEEQLGEDDEGEGMEVLVGLRHFAGAQGLRERRGARGRGRGVRGVKWSLRGAGEEGGTGRTEVDGEGLSLRRWAVEDWRMPRRWEELWGEKEDDETIEEPTAAETSGSTSSTIEHPSTTLSAESTSSAIDDLASHSPAHSPNPHPPSSLSPGPSSTFSPKPSAHSTPASSLSPSPAVSSSLKLAVDEPSSPPSSTPASSLERDDVPPAPRKEEEEMDIDAPFPSSSPSHERDKVPPSPSYAAPAPVKVELRETMDPAWWESVVGPGELDAEFEEV